MWDRGGVNAVALLDVLDRAKSLLALPGNDFSWSSFGDAQAALGELDAACAAIRAGRAPATLTILFAPTGPIQEVALSSGWGGEFLVLAERFDAAVRGDD